MEQKTIKGLTRSEYQKAYNKANRDKIIKCNKAYYEANKDKIAKYKKAYNKAYNKANRDKIAKYIKAYYEANKDKIIKYNKAYNKANKDKIKEHFRNTHICIPSLGSRNGKKIMYTNGVTKEIKEKLPEIVNDVLEDCIKNPRKFLDDEEVTKSHNIKNNKPSEVSSHSSPK